MRRTIHDCLTFTIGAISAICIVLRHNFRNVGPILKDTGHFDRRIAKRYFKACIFTKNIGSRTKSLRSDKLILVQVGKDLMFLRAFDCTPYTGNVRSRY